MLLSSSESQLVLIDYQTRLLPAINESDIVIAQALKLAQIAKLLRVPITGTEQNPAGLGQNHDALRALCGQTLVKTHFDGCADGLGDLLRDIGTPKPSPMQEACLNICKKNLKTSVQPLFWLAWKRMFAFCRRRCL